MKDPGYGLMFLAIPRVVLLLLECAYHPAGSNLERAEMMLVELRGSHACVLHAFFSFSFYSFLFFCFSPIFLCSVPALALPISIITIGFWFLPSGTVARRILFIGLVGAVRARKCLSRSCLTDEGVGCFTFTHVLKYPRFLSHTHTPIPARHTDLWPKLGAKGTTR